MYLNTIVGGHADSGNHFYGQRNHFVKRSVELELVSVAGKFDIRERRIRNAVIEKICQIADVGVNDAGFYVDEKRLGVVEGRVNSAGGACHLPAEPTHINAV